MANKIALIILDGYGIGVPNNGNAIYMANTPCMDDLLAHSPVTHLSASGLDVGLPDGQMGNSEVGHTNIGAGRVVFQTLPKISEEIKSGKFFENEVYAKAMDAAKENGKALHIMGLMSNGGVHSHIEHIFAAMDMAKQRGVETVYVHAFLDGRDVAPTSGKDFVQQLQNHCEAVGNAKIGVVSGRFYAMDRDKRWDRVEQAYNALVLGDIGYIAVDSIYTPVKKVNYYVQNTRVGQNIDYDKLTIEVETNGTLSAREVISLSGKLIQDHIGLFVDLVESMAQMDILVCREEDKQTKVLEMTIEDIDLSVRSYNCLKRAGINTVDDLTKKSESDLAKVKNLGKRSLEEVAAKLQSFGLSLRNDEE